MEVDHPRAKKVLSDLTSLLGPDFRPPESGFVPETKQLREFVEQATVLMRAHANRPRQLGTVAGNWQAVRRVLARAYPGSPSLDIAEEGVWLGAIRVSNDASRFEADVKALHALARSTVPRYDSGELRFASTPLCQYE